MSKQNAKDHIRLGNADTALIRNEHSNSHTDSKTRSDEVKLPSKYSRKASDRPNRKNKKKVTEVKDSHNSDLTQVTSNVSCKSMSNMKRTQAVDCKLPCKKAKVKEEPTSIPDIINLADDSPSDISSNDSSNDDSDSSIFDDEMVIVTVKNTPLKMEISKKIFMENVESIYEGVRNIVGRDTNLNTENTLNISCKKIKKSKHKKKKKRHKDRKLHLTTVGNEFNSANEPELKRERVEEPESERKLPVWLEPPSPYLEKLNSASESVHFSNVKDRIAFSHCNVEASSIENVDSRSSNSRAYEEMDNGDLDYLEETMDYVVPSLEELNSQVPMESNGSSSGVQLTSQLEVHMINGTEDEQWIKYEPELNINDVDESIYRALNDSSNVPLLETIKHEPSEEDPKIASSRLDPVAFNKTETINTALINSEPAIIKRELVEEEPKSENSEFDVITLSDGDTDDKRPTTDFSCKIEIKSEQIEDNGGEILNDRKNFPHDSVPSDRSDGDVRYHESLQNKLLKEIRELSSRIEKIKEEVEDARLKENSQDSSVNDISEERPLFIDDSNDAIKNTTSEHKLLVSEIKRERSESDEEIEATDEGAICKDPHGNRSTEDNVADRSSKKLQSTGNNPRDEKQSRNKTKSRDKKKSLDETNPCGKEISSDKERSIDEKLSYYEQRSSYEKASPDEMRSRIKKRSKDERRLKEKNKSYDEQRSKDENRCHEQKRSKNQKISRHVKEELLDRISESEDESLKKSEHNATSHKHEAVERRHSSEAKSARISDSNNDNSNEDLSRAETALNPRLMLSEFPLVVLTKLNDPIKSPLPIKPSILTTDKPNIKEIDKSSNNQERPTASASITETLESNEREIPSAKELKNSASKSTTKSNSDFRLKSKTEMKCHLIEHKQQRKSTDSVASRRKKKAQLKGEALKEVIKKIALKEAVKQIAETTKKISEFKSTVELLTARLEVKMTVGAGGHLLVEENGGQMAKQSTEPTSAMNEKYEQHVIEGEYTEGKNRNDKSVDLVKETASNRGASPVNRDKYFKGKTEKSKTLDVNRKESSKVKVETPKSLDLAKETLPKAGTSADGVGNSVEQILSTKTKFSFDIERKSVAAFVGKIPKKSATQPTVCNADGSPIEDHQSNKIWKPVVTMVEKSRKRKAHRAPRRPRATSKPVDTKACPSLEQFLLRIFQWNPAWLKENWYLNTTRKVVDEENLAPMRPSYETYEDYYSDAERLLALEVWHGMTSKKEMEAMRAKPCVMFSIVSRSVNLAKVPSTDIELTTLLLDVVVSKREALTQAHPLIGDLVFFEYFTNWQGTECFTEAEVFAYVTDVRTNIISSKTRFNRDLLNFVQDSHTLLTYTVITKRIHHSVIQPNRVCKMTTIPYFRPNTRRILALQCLPDSPLLNKILHPKVEKYQLPPARNLENYPLVTQDKLNAKQLEAVARITEAVVQRVPQISLIEGPPGTGKTKVIVNLITQTIQGGGRYQKNMPSKILVCAPSNAAIDEIVMRSQEKRRMFPKGQRFKMVRVGRDDTMHQNVKEVSLTELAKKEVHRFINTCGRFTAEKAETVKTFYEKQITELEYERTNARNADARKHITRKIEDVRAKYDVLENLRTAKQLDQKEKEALRKSAENRILEGAHVIACTLVSCCSSYMEAIFARGENNVISACIVDEATLSSEADILLPLLLGVRTLVLVGDAHQQPAPILPNKTKLCGLDQSLFARVQQAFAGQAINPTIQFDTQYRMSHPVAYWPKEYFYSGALYSVADLPPLPLHSYKVIDLDSSQDEDVKPVATNTCEALFVACLVFTLITRAGLDHLKAPIRVGVITPYKRQKLLIEKKIEDRLERLSPERKQNIIFDVNTIDGFQGQERDVIIISCVRTNGIGFLADRQRLCLALTRAKHSLILCGNFQTFQSDPMWNALLSDAQFRGAYVNVRWNVSADEIKPHVVR